MALLTTKVAAVPLKLTVVAPVRFVPVIVTAVPMTPVVGEKLVTVGEATVAVTVKLPDDVALPPSVVMEILPVVAPLGTIAAIRVALLTANTAAAEPLNDTAVASVKLAPVTITVVPTGPDTG